MLYTRSPLNTMSAQPSLHTNHPRVVRQAFLMQQQTEREQMKRDMAAFEQNLTKLQLDNNIIERMHTDYQLDKNYARMCIQANKHNHISASYYLLLKEIIKKGEKSIADVRSPDYNPDLFLYSAQQVKNDKIAAPAVEREDMKLVRNETQSSVVNNETV